MESLSKLIFPDSLKGLPITSWLFVLTAGLLTVYLVDLWMKVRQLPPGPIPMPIVGNMLSFCSARPLMDILIDMKKRYGGIFTLFVAGKPFIVVSDWRLVKEGLVQKRNDIISRPDFRSFRHLEKEFMGIISGKNDRKWEVTRKVGGSAIRKFADGEKLANIVHNASKAFVSNMMKLNTKPFDPTAEIQILVLHILSETAFGIKGLTKKENEKLTSLFKTFQELSGNTPGDIATWLLVLFYHRDLAMQRAAKFMGKFLTEKYNENKKTYQRGNMRNFTDAVITSGIEALEDDNDAKEYLDDKNMMKIIGALFTAGIETTATSLQWIMLLMANFPETQNKIFVEIDQNIGKRMPVQLDRKNCHYTWAFISEALRFRSPVPLGVPHATSVDTELGGFKIKKGNAMFFFSHAVHMDSEIWAEPERFKPERFLNADGTFNNDRTGFLAFGDGKRICVGEKMARNDIFLVIANVLQNGRIKLDGPPGSANLNSQNTMVNSVPIPYKIIFEKRD